LAFSGRKLERLCRVASMIITIFQPTLSSPYPEEI